MINHLGLTIQSLNLELWIGTQLGT